MYSLPGLLVVVINNTLELEDILGIPTMYSVYSHIFPQEIRSSMYTQSCQQNYIMTTY